MRCRSDEKRRLSLEPLEPRHLLAVTVFLDFGEAGSGVGNDFAARVTELTDSLGRLPPTVAQIDLLKTGIQANLESAFAAWDVTFTTSPPATGEYETLGYGWPESAVAANPERFGFAQLDWLNGLHGSDPDSATAYVFPAEFAVPALTGLSPGAFANRLANALGFYGVHELGHAFGLKNQDAFGDPSITPDNYHNTLDIQNRHFMADGVFGFTFTEFSTTDVTLEGFTFSPLDRVKLELADGLADPPPPGENRLVLETNLDHATPATAQALTLVPLPASSSQGVNVSGTILNEADVYQFSATAGELVTVNVMSADVYQFRDLDGQYHDLDALVRLIGPSGASVLATADDAKVGATTFGDTFGTTTLDVDPLLINFRIPTTGTYFVEVTNKLAEAGGFYDLVIAKWTPVLRPWQNPDASQARDVSADGAIVARDALLVINRINRAGNAGGRLPNPPVGAENPVVVTGGQTNYFYFDVSGDDFVSAIDALLIINHINNPDAPQGGEGEEDLDNASSDDFSAAAVDDALAAAAAWWGEEFWRPVGKKK